MNRNDLLLFHKACLVEMHEILSKKNADYSRNEDPFSNFRLVEALGLATAPNGVMIRLLDKVSRASNLISGQKAHVAESLRDTLLDLANYSLLILAMLESKKTLPKLEDSKALSKEPCCVQCKEASVKNQVGENSGVFRAKTPTNISTRYSACTKPSK